MTRTFSWCEIVGKRFPICHVHISDTVVEVCICPSSKLIHNELCLIGCALGVLPLQTEILAYFPLYIVCWHTHFICNANFCTHNRSQVSASLPESMVGT